MKPGGKENDKTRAKEQIKLYESQLYKEGSEACRNYSRLTMEVRTLSQKVLIAAFVAFSVATIGKESVFDKVFDYIFICGGIVLVCFGVSLALIDWHYQSAFAAIRNSLVEMEKPERGAWSFHLCVRNKQNDFVASYAPFWILEFIGALATFVGLSYAFSQKRPVWLYVIGGIGIVIVAIAVWVFIHIYNNQGNISLEVCENEMKKCEPKKIASADSIPNPN